jgi:hypothetical protein
VLLALISKMVSKVKVACLSRYLYENTIDYALKIEEIHDGKQTRRNDKKNAGFDPKISFGGYCVLSAFKGSLITIEYAILLCKNTRKSRM